jgi:hypothetical protein
MILKGFGFVASFAGVKARGKEYKKVEIKRGKPRWRIIMTEFVVKRKSRMSEIREKAGTREI